MKNKCRFRCVWRDLSQFICRELLFSVMVLLVLPVGTTSGAEVEDSIASKKKSDSLRVAMIPCGQNKEFDTILSMAEMALTDLPEISLVERALVGKVLHEQTMTKMLAVDSDAVLKLGSIIPADLFVIILVGKKSDSYVKVFDAQTGVRYADSVLSLDDAEKARQDLAQVVRLAARKNRSFESDAADSSAIVTISMLATRNTELPRSFDITAQTLARLVEQRLLSSERVAVLERRNLDVVSKESDLTGQPERNRLRTAAIQLNLELSNGKEPGGILATLTRAHMQKASFFQAEGNPQNLPQMADTLVSGVLETLAGKSEPLPSLNHAEEALRYGREAEFLFEQMHLKEASIAAETALALMPKDQSCIRRVVEYQGTFAVYTLCPKRFHVSSLAPFHVSTETLERALDSMERALSLMPQLESTSSNFIHILCSDKTYTFLEKANCIASGHSEETISRLDALKAQAISFQRRGFDTVREQGISTEKELNDYEKRASHFLSLLRVSKASEFQFVNAYIHVVTGIADVYRNPSFVTLREKPFRSVIWGSLPEGVRRYESIQKERLATFAETLISHPNPSMAFNGKRIKRRMTYYIEEEKSPRSEAAMAALQDVIHEIESIPLSVPLKTYVDLYEDGDFYVEEMRVGYARKWRQNNPLIECMFKRGDVPLRMLIKCIVFPLTHELDEKDDAAALLEVADDYLEKVKNVTAERTDDIKNFPDWYRQCVERRNDFALKYVPEKAPQNRLWSKETKLFSVTEPARQFVRALVDEDTIYLITFEQTAESTNTALRLVIIDAASGKVDERKSFPFVCNRREWDTSITSMFLQGKMLYFGTADNGLGCYNLENDSLSYFDDKNGLPCRDVTAVGYLNGFLYLGLGSGNDYRHYNSDTKSTYLVRINTNDDAVEVLGSSLRKEGTAPFDGRHPSRIMWFSKDPHAERLLFFALRGKSPGDGVKGLWEVTSKGEINSVCDFWNVWEAEYGVTWQEDGQMLIVGTSSFLFDVTHRTAQFLYVGASVREPKVIIPGQPKQTAKIQHVRAFGRAALIDGWYWCSDIWSRISLENEKQEILPPPGKARWDPRIIFSFNREKRYLVAADFKALMKYDLLPAPKKVATK